MMMSKKVLAGLAAWLMISGTLAGAATVASASPTATNQGEALSTNQSKSFSPAVPRVRFSPGIVDIVRMVQAKVDPEVILAYIKNSPVPYNPGAGEIIALKARGVPQDILAALLEHGAELRTKSLAPAQTPAYPPGPPAGPPAPPPSMYPSYGGYPAYPPVNYSYNTLGTILYGPLISFNNSFGTLVNGNVVYSGYYVPGYGILW